MHTSAQRPINPALTRAIATTLCEIHPSPAPQGATKTHTAPQASPAPRKSNPPHRQNSKPLNPNQLSAARLLLAGHSVTAVAAALHVDPYTVSRWKKDPRFQSELHCQLALLSDPLLHPAPHGATMDHTAPHFTRAGAKRTQNPPS